MVAANRLRRIEARWLPMKAMLLQEPQSSRKKENVDII
jgi:hypothetical protein